MDRGPGRVEHASELALAALAGAFPATAVSGSREQWAGAIRSLQRVIDRASAAQDAAIVRLAAIEPEELDDGTEVESHRAPGHVALDAPAILSGVLSVAAVHAERRVRTAVRRAADGPAGTETDTGLGGLHAAMAAGRLDAYRAEVVAEELEEAPAEVRAAVVAALAEHLETEDAAHLRRRCRRALARISPDLLRQRAQRARAESGLRRWADEPGVDRWEGTFPSEEAAQAWAAIDSLARRFVADAVCATIERARAKALTDLVAGNATVETVVTVTVPAAALDEPSAEGARPSAAAAGVALQPPDGAGREDLVEVTGPTGAQPVLVSRGWLTSAVEAHRDPDVAPCHPATGALLDGRADVARALGSFAKACSADGYRPPKRVIALVRARDRRCRFPGCTVAAVFCDVDHARPWPAGRTAAENLMCLCRRHHRVKQRPGWRVVLTADGVATWTDPTGRVRTTLPADALHVTVLCGGADPPTPASAPHGTSRPRTLVPDGQHSSLEFRLQHLGALLPAVATARHRHGHGRHRHGRHRIDVLHDPASVVLDLGAHRPRRRHPPAGRPHDTDPPPF